MEVDLASGNPARGVVRAHRQAQPVPELAVGAVGRADANTSCCRKSDRN